MSPSVYGSRTWLGWVLWLRVSLEAVIRVSARAAVTPTPDSGKSPFQAHSAWLFGKAWFLLGGWAESLIPSLAISQRPPSVPCLGDFSIQLPPSSSQTSERSKSLHASRWKSPSLLGDISSLCPTLSTQSGHTQGGAYTAPGGWDMGSVLEAACCSQVARVPLT